MIARMWLPVAATAFLLAAPSYAAADHGAAVLDDTLADYMAVALAFWGGPAPTCVANGITLIPVHAVMFDDPNPRVAARADQPGCRISLDVDHWRHQDPIEACTLIVHEWGHLLGYGHSGDPANVMAENPTRVPAGCFRFARAVARSSARACRASLLLRRHPRRPACARPTRLGRTLSR